MSTIATTNPFQRSRRLHFRVDFFGFVGFSNVASTVREISSSVRPLDTAFRTAFLMRFTAFFCFSFPPAIVYASQPLMRCGRFELATTSLFAVGASCI